MFRWVASAAVIMSPAAAQAVVVSITEQFTGSYYDAYAGSTGSFTANSNPVSLDNPSEVGLLRLKAGAVAATNGVDSFNFQHDLYALGGDRAFAETILTVKITNDSMTAQNLRFDSQITPGHVAIRNPYFASQSSGEADINFGVTLDGTSLYSLNEVFNTPYPSTPPGPEFLKLNGLTKYTDITNTSGQPQGNSLLAYDFGYTNIHLELGSFDPNQTKTLVYDLFTQVISSSIYRDNSSCPSVQLSFGDPLRAGPQLVPATRSLAAANVAPNATPGDGGCFRPNPVTSLSTSASTSYIHIVPSGSDYPPAPDLFDAPDYTYGVPEPAAAALFGLGALGLLVARWRRG